MPTNTNYLDWLGLQTYDALIKEYMDGVVKNSKITLYKNTTDKAAGQNKIDDFTLNQLADKSIALGILTESEIKNIIKYGRADVTGLTSEELANLEKYGQTDVDGLTDSEKEALERAKLQLLGLHKVASSGSYTDLEDKPTILDSAAINTLIDNRISGGDSDTTVLTDQNYTDFVKNGSLIIKRNNTTFKDNENHDIIYTANQDGTTIINIPVPEKITDLTDYLNQIQNIIKYGIADTTGKTSEQLENLEKYGQEDITGLTEVQLAELEAAKLAKLNLAKVAISGSYNDLEDTPTVYTLEQIQNIVRYGRADISGLTENQLENLEKYGSTEAPTTDEEKEQAEQAQLDKLGLHKIAKTGDYADLINTPSYSVNYDSTTKKIQLKNGNNVVSEFDASEFIVDGMVDDVRIENSNLIIDFNTDSGKQDISIPISNIFNASNYYDKTDVDNLLNYGTTTPTAEASTDPVVHESDLEDFLTTETDPVFAASPAANITAQNITDWNNKVSNVQADWSATTGLGVILNKPTLANVATSGSYNDLSDKPTIPTKVSDLTNDSGFINAETDPVFTASAASGITAQNISDWNNKISGIKVGDTTIQPVNGVVTIPESDSNVQADWEEDDSTSDAYIQNKPNILTEAQINALFGGGLDPTSNPTIITSSNLEQQVAAKGFIKSANIPTKTSDLINDSGFLTAHQDISGKANTADLATVATSGSYNDLINKPTIPAAQIQADWNQTDNTALDFINNKPTLFSGSYNDLTDKPTIPATYNALTYEIGTAQTIAGGALSVDGTKALHVITTTAAISGITFSEAPADGHSCHVIITAASELTVSIAHGATMVTGYTSVCPEAKALDITIPAGGYIEVDLLRVGTNIYVRGV